MRSVLQRITKRLVELDNLIHGDKHFGSKQGSYKHYGRGVEQASGFGLWIASYVWMFGALYAGVVFNDISSLFWGIMAFCVGFCQLYYSSLAQRVVFTILASSLWIYVSFFLFVVAGYKWNLGMAATLPMAVFNFYIFGFVFNEFMDDRECVHSVWSEVK